MKKIGITALLVSTATFAARADDASYAPQTYSQPNSYTQPAPMTESYSSPATGHVGVGVILGEPVGASVKYWLNDTMAVDGAAGWSGHEHSTLYFHGDVLWHKFDLFDISPAPGRLPLYFGVGGLVRFRNHGEGNNVGVRVPVGVSYIFDNAPIDVFGEIAPALDVAPDLHGEVTGGIGIRFWF
jgi:hypothetical protein